ncbi:unknown [Clostridium sp. CAG:389]|nr:unknown [Clostridium sp. CAG:389]
MLENKYKQITISEHISLIKFPCIFVVAVR